MVKYAIVNSENNKYQSSHPSEEYTHDIERAVVRNDYDQAEQLINDECEYVYEIDNDIEFGDDKV